MKFVPFDEARGFVQKLDLSSRNEWRNYCKSGEKPDYLPLAPHRVYKNQWKGWGDFLGTGRAANQKRIYLPFEKARKLAQSLHIKSSMQWRQHYAASKIPKGIPSHPDRVYRKNWKGWGYWLGANHVSIQNKNFEQEVFLNKNSKWMEFKYAKPFVKSLGLKSRFEWKLFCKSGKKPDNIPEYPAFIYSANWKGWSDWLGSTNFKIKFKSFVDARRYSRALKLKSKKQWIEFLYILRSPGFEFPLQSVRVPGYGLSSP